jgi:hypothetical protein
MGRLYDAFVEVGPRFTGFGDIKKQGDQAGKEYGKALADAAAKAAQANVRKLGEALGKARQGEADAAGKVRVAETKLNEVRANSKAKASQIAAAEEALARRSGSRPALRTPRRMQPRRWTRPAIACPRPQTRRRCHRWQVQPRVQGLGVEDRRGARRQGVRDPVRCRHERRDRRHRVPLGGDLRGRLRGDQERQVFSGFINDARESAKVGRVSAQVVKSTGGAAKITADQMGDLATAISNKTGADDEAIQSGENLLATFTNVRNETGKGNKVFDRATQAAVDMASAMNNGVVDANGLKAANIQLGKALNDPIKGVTALSKVGVSFTAEQKKQIKTLVDSGNTLKAQKIILNEVGKEFGGAAQAATDPLTKLHTIVGNVSENDRGVFLPYVDKAATWLGNHLPGAVDTAGKFFNASSCRRSRQSVVSSATTSSRPRRASSPRSPGSGRSSRTRSGPSTCPGSRLGSSTTPRRGPAVSSPA